MKRCAVSCGFMLILCLCGLSFAQEFLSITTYYPSPYGSYRELSAYQMKIGQNYSGSGIPFVNNGLIVEGNLGIGTTGPAGELDVSSTGEADIFVNSASRKNANIWFRSGGVNTLALEAIYHPEIDKGETYITNNSYGNIHFRTTNKGEGTNYRMTLSPSGNLGIGTLNPGYKLDVAGAAHFTSHSDSSDIRFKKILSLL